jgi:long-chain acyl-CoA synthetase
VQFLPSFLVGRKLVMMYKWDAGKALELIEQEKITAMTGVPTMGQDLIEHPDFSKRDISSLKEVSSGGAPKPPEQVRSMAKKAPQLRAGVGYGLTEVNGAVASMGGADYLKYPESCGKAIPPLTSIKIIREDGSDAKPGEWGEVCIKSPSVMQGYLNRPDATAEALTTDGWFKTGDIGYINEEAYLFLVDRAKDIVIRGGENIGCAEVEGAIALHDAVMEVAVYGVPHERLGEVVSATVMLKPGTQLSEQALKDFLKDKISAFKQPEYIFFQTEQLPRGATEKIYKKGIREVAIKKLQPS